MQRKQTSEEGQRTHHYLLDRYTLEHAIIIMMNHLAMIPLSIPAAHGETTTWQGRL